MRKRESWHGTTGGYTNHACRCMACRRAWTDRCLAKREARAAALAGTPEVRGQRGAAPKPPTEVKHGSESTYFNWGCKCEPCRDAHRLGEAARRQRREEKRHATT